MYRYSLPALLIDTNIQKPIDKLFTKGLAYAPIERISGVTLLAATDPDYSTHGSYYTIPDSSEALRLSRDELGLATVGMYKTLQDRVDRVFK